MRRPSLLALIVCLTVAGGAGAQSLEQQLKDRLLGGSAGGSTAGLSEKDAAGGIKEALAQGVDRAVRQLGAPDGFFRDQAVKILVPERLRKAADLARRFGAGRQVDAFELSMNRAAEKAVPMAANILADSVRKMTVQDAMRHTTGFTYGGGGFGATAVHKAHPGSSLNVARDYDAAGLAAALAATPLLNHPGEVWEYGFSTDVLGLVVGAVAGRSLGTVMRERIFGPLGMAETGYVLPEGGAARFAKALPTCPITGAPQSVAAPAKAPRLEVGGAGLVSTVSDYLRFAEMLRAGGSLGGERVLSPATVRWMASDHMQGIEGGPDRVDPGLDGYGFGLTVTVRRNPGGSAFMGAPGAFGWSGVFGTYFWVDPKEELAVVLMSHVPGELRRRYRVIVNMLTYQAIEG